MDLRNEDKNPNRPPSLSETEEGTSDDNDSFNAYLEYNKVLRTWFVAFGIGGPALFLTNEKLATSLGRAHCLRTVCILFVIGAASQILGALVNKVANYYIYYSTVDPKFEETWQYRASDWVVRQFWFDISIDALTGVVFVCAAWRVLEAFVASNSPICAIALFVYL